MIQVTKNFFTSEVNAYRKENNHDEWANFLATFSIDKSLSYNWANIKDLVKLFYQIESKESTVAEYDGCLEYEELTLFLKSKGVYLSPYDQYNYRKLVDIAYLIHESKYPQYA